MANNYTIPHALLQETVDFLGKYPYEDVFKLIPKLWALQPIPKVDPKERSSD